MRNQPSSPETPSKSFLGSRGGSFSSLSSKSVRFRFPFKQKSPPSGVSLSRSQTISTDSPSGSYGSGGGGGFLGLRKHFKASQAPGGSNIMAARKLHSPGSPTNMDWKRKITPDHTDQAYREAVTRLRTMLSPRPQSRSSILNSPVKGEKSLASALDGSPEMPKKTFNNSIRSMFLKDSNNATGPSILNNNNANLYSSGGMKGSASTPEYLADREDDLFGFIEKQGEYITQLEKETKYCRDELSTMLEKVREVISENEALHEQQKKDILTSMIKQLDEKTAPPSLDTARQAGKKSNYSGASNVILESRVAELEAQLSQARRSLRLAQQEVMDFRKGKLEDLKVGGSPRGNPGESIGTSHDPYAHCDLHRDEIERLAREKEDLQDTMSKLKHMMTELKDRETDAAKKVKSSLEIIEHMRVEKDQSDMETSRLKEELDRYQKRVRDMIQDHTRKLHEEKLQVERKYRQELDHLNNEMTQELDSLTKARIDLERQKRIETDLRRELELKQATIDDMRQETQIKLGHLQKELAHALSKKSSVEQELINTRLNAEKMERDAKQEAIRFQAEINALRKRLEQADADLVNTQDTVAKLNQNISQFQREASMAKLRLEEHISGDPEMQDKDVMGLIQDMEEKHSRDMTELEQLIQVQNNLLDKLRGECKTLTDKLEDTHRQYKEELRSGLQSCVDSIRNNDNSSGTATSGDAPQESSSTEESPEVMKLQEQLDDFLRLHTALIEELVEILQEMNECISSNETSSKEKAAEDTEEKDRVEESEKNQEDSGQVDDQTPAAENADVEKSEEVKTDADTSAEDGSKKEETSEKEGEEGKEKDEAQESEPPVETKEGDATANQQEENSAKDDGENKVEEKETNSNENNDGTSEDDLKFKVMEMNSQLKSWARRMESIIERFSSYSQNRADS